MQGRELPAALLRARLMLAFERAEANAAHEFGDMYAPGADYLELRRRVIDGELTFDEAEAIDLTRIAARLRGQALEESADKSSMKKIS